ncbi:MAG: pyridoxamine 5'-phosphate oxidase [Polyangiaceae bacterium]|nr:pyridoxamine 5'-phosphate oxidase [Polyangiaceae bacterium]
MPAPTEQTAIDPLERLATLIDEARRRNAPEPDAMALATATAAGVPSVRIVLCRGIDARGLRFFTNYESRKGDEIAENPHAAVCFFWPVLDVQVRAEGTIAKVPAAESDAYFEHRPRGHRISALASAQSRPIASLDALKEEARRIEREHEGKPVPRPAYWGGYCLSPVVIEIWARGVDRLHERLRFTRRGEGWAVERLAP